MRDDQGDLLKIVETKAPGDATPEELAIDEVNAGVYAFDAVRLPDALAQIGNDNAQAERYLPDVLAVLRASGGAIGAVTAADPDVVLGVNDRWQLAQVGEVARMRLLRAHAEAGVTFLDPSSVLVDVDVTIGQDTTIEPGVQLRAGTTVGRDCLIGQGTVAIGSDIADGATIRSSTLDGAAVGEGASVGPYAYLRPGAQLQAAAKVGTFVEIKKLRDRRGVEGAAPLVHRRCRRRAGFEPRGGDDHGELQREDEGQVAHEPRCGRAHERRHHAGGAGHPR